MRRNLDGAYFRIGKENICFSDMTKEQRYKVMEDRDVEWLKTLCNVLAETIKIIGDENHLMNCDPVVKGM